VQALAADLKIELLHSQKGRPQGRGKIERFFRTVEQELLVDLPGYAPKVDWRLQAESDRQSKPGACLTIAEFDAIFRSWLLEQYHTQAQEGIGEAPMRRWEAGGMVPVLPPSLEHLDVLLLTFSTRRRVQQDGIAFQGQRYFDVALAEYVGEEVVVRYDPSDRKEIAVYVPEANTAKSSEDVRERFVCRARCSSVTRERMAVREVVEERARRREELRKELREHRASVKRYASTEGEKERWKAVARQAATRSEDEEGKVVVEEVREESFEQEDEEPEWKRYEHE
jgi:putative transposase